MQASTIRLSLITALTLAAFTAPAAAGLSDSRNFAYEFSARYANQGYRVQPGFSDLDNEGTERRFEFSVSRGVDYIFLLAGDRSVTKIDIMVFDENKNLLVEDKRTRGKWAGIAWTSNYTGTAHVWIRIARTTDSPVGWTALVGRRGNTGFVPPSPASPGGGADASEDPAGATE